MSIVGHPKVTKRAYEQGTEERRAAMQFAEACVSNGLGKDAILLSSGRLLLLKAQIERDFLVATMSPANHQTHKGDAT